MGRSLLLLIIFAGAIGAITADRGGTGAPPGPDMPDVQPEHAAEAPQDPEPGTIELKRETDGHFYAEVEINGTPVRALVDTGASGIALTREDARRAGLAVSAGMFEVVGQGAGGDVHGEFAELDRVALGHRSAEDLPAVILDAGDISLLGQSFLGRFQSVEISGDTMTLR